MNISKRADSIQASPIRRLAPLMLEAKRRGRAVYHLNIGQPDIETPKAYWEAIANHGDPVLSYGPSDGLPELKEAVAEYFGRYGVSIEPKDILVTTGGSEAILFAFCSVCDPGDQVIIPEPFYTNYNGFATMAGMEVVPVRSRAENGFALPPLETIEAAVGPRTRAILICSPNNPTGYILTWDEIQGLAELARKHDLFLIGDEVYKEFTYEGAEHRSLLELEGLDDRVIVTDSISKRFSACGARVGTVVSRNRKVMEACLKFGQARLCPPTLEQVGAIAAYNMDPGYFDPIRKEYQDRRDILLEGIRKDPGVFVKRPPGAFYMVVSLDIPDADDFAQWLLRDFESNGETVMVAPANGFYATEGAGLNEVRMAYVLETQKLERAAEVFIEGLAEYRKLA